DVEYGYRREPPHEIDEHRALLRVEPHACEPGSGEAVERPGREDEEEVRAEGVPFHLAEREHLGLDGLPRDVEGQAVAKLEPEVLLVLGRDRDIVLSAVRGAPPAAGH